MKALSIEQLVVDYKAPHGQPPLNVVDHIDLELEGGDFVVIVGPSGCGKSSLLRVAAGLVEPTSGRVLVGGKLADRPGADRGWCFKATASMNGAPFWATWSSGSNLPDGVRRNDAIEPEI